MNLEMNNADMSDDTLSWSAAISGVFPLLWMYTDGDILDTGCILMVIY